MVMELCKEICLRRNRKVSSMLLPLLDFMGYVDSVLAVKHICRFLLLSLTLVLCGCASYGTDIKTAKSSAALGDYHTAKLQIEKALSADGDDALLYYLELGMIEHLAQNYQKSNTLLDKAEQVAEELYTQRVTDMLEVMMTSPRSGPYRGALHERVLAYYVKVMNYFMLAQSTEDFQQKSIYIEAARIESRRAEILLRDIETQKGSYADAKEEEETIFGKLMNFFAVLNGDYEDKTKLVYRRDAWMNYMVALSYEKNGEWDDARISYEKSAKLYESGYREQYDLSREMTTQAWIDTVRMMKKSGWPRWEWKRTARKKLSSEPVS